MTSTFKTDENVVDTKRPSRDIHQEVTNTIIEQLEKGTVPWLKPWDDSNNISFNIPKNNSTNKKYRGINIVLLWASAYKNQFGSSEWASYKQWSAQDQAVRKGEKGTMIVYYDTFEKENEKAEVEKIPYLKQSVVFNKAQLVDYKPGQSKDQTSPKGFAEKIDTVESFVTNTNVIVEQPYPKACYNRITDKISMPDRSAFIDTDHCTATEGYYATLLHELTHWTGHPSRLNRTFGKRFGDKQYAVEELVAELGAAFTTTEFGLSRPKKENHASYIAHWLDVLRENKYTVVAAASEASKAHDYLHKLQPV